jgi:hypothetical protein
MVEMLKFKLLKMKCHDCKWHGWNTKMHIVEDEMPWLTLWSVYSWRWSAKVEMLKCKLLNMKFLGWNADWS